jgi:hypothetical protein
MRKRRVYIETTMFNYYLDKDRDAHADTVAFFEECTAGKFEPYTSLYVVGELEEAQGEKREEMIALIKGTTLPFCPPPRKLITSRGDMLMMVRFRKVL